MLLYSVRVLWRVFYDTVTHLRQVMCYLSCASLCSFSPDAAVICGYANLKGVRFQFRKIDISSEKNPNFIPNPL